MCFRDMTFCTYEKCARFGMDCWRSYTPDVHKAAERWWGKPNPPVCFFAETPPCYEEDSHADGTQQNSD